MATDEYDDDAEELLEDDEEEDEDDEDIDLELDDDALVIDDLDVEDDDVDEVDDEEDEEDGAEDEAEDEEEAEEEGEESLDVLLAREQGDEESIVRLDDEPKDGLVSVTTPIGADEFTCRSCFLVKRRAQLADEKKLICFDCA